MQDYMLAVSGLCPEPGKPGFTGLKMRSTGLRFRRAMYVFLGVGEKNSVFHIRLGPAVAIALLV